MLDQRQELVQRQSLSAKQIQQIQLLEVPAIELEERIRKELEVNPALDDTSVSAEKNPLTSDANGVEQDADYGTEEEIPYYRLKQLAQQEAEREEIPFAGLGLSLQDFLMEQIATKSWTERQKLIATYIVGNIRDDGYLDGSATQIGNDLLFKESMDVPTPEIEQLIKEIKQLDPAGVAASTLQECLLLQLERMDRNHPLVAEAQYVLRKQFTNLVKKRYEVIVQDGVLTEQTLQETIQFIKTLNPKPGNGFDNTTKTVLGRVYPDFIISEIDNRLVLTLTDERELPSLQIAPDYEKMAQNHTLEAADSPAQKEAQKFAAQKVEQAQWFISALQQRFHTLRSTMEVIMYLQEEFIKTGSLSDLKPMILKDVAQRTGLDVSTISRVSNSKFVQAPHGIYPLKFFFSEGAQTDQGEWVSNKEVKEQLLLLVEQENKKAPLTDLELAEALQEKGYQLARRTVAKYREQLSIPAARMRREL